MWRVDEMISKELLSEVLNIENERISRTVDKFCFPNTNTIAVQYYMTDGWQHINIYELAHKCKEWAYKKEYALTPMNDFGFGNKDTDNFKSYWTSCYINLRPSNGTHLYCVEMTSEPEAIFKACEWIMEQTK